MIQTFVSTALFAVVSSITFIAYAHPNSYFKLLPFILWPLALISVVMLSYNCGFISGNADAFKHSLALAEKASINCDPHHAIDSSLSTFRLVNKEGTFPVYWLILLVAFIFYFSMLGFLPGWGITRQAGNTPEQA